MLVFVFSISLVILLYLLIWSIYSIPSILTEVLMWLKCNIIATSSKGESHFESPLNGHNWWIKLYWSNWYLSMGVLVMNLKKISINMIFNLKLRVVNWIPTFIVYIKNKVIQSSFYVTTKCMSKSLMELSPPHPTVEDF